MAACFRRTGAAHSREPQHATPHKVDAIFRLASSARVARRGLLSNEQSILRFADSNASLWMSSRAATDTESVPPARDLSPSRSSASGGKRISVSTLTLSSKRLIEIEMLYPRWLYCGTCTSACDGNPGPVPCCRGLYGPSESRRRGPRGQLMTLGGDHDAPSSEDLGERLRILVLRCSKFAHVNQCRVFRIKY